MFRITKIEVGSLWVGSQALIGVKINQAWRYNPKIKQVPMYHDFINGNNKVTSYNNFHGSY